ncbi:MAG: hypothetical protein ACETWQ_22060, partial [Phycisphaerae bacterium]
ASGRSISLLPAIQATGSLASAPERLTPSEHASLSWSHYLIRFHTENCEKYLYFSKELTFIRTRYRQINNCSVKMETGSHLKIRVFFSTCKEVTFFEEFWNFTMHESGAFLSMYFHSFTNNVANSKSRDFP